MGKKNTTKTICWECGNTGKCSWGAHGIPVEGWTAKPELVGKSKGNGAFISYIVKSCPEYKPFERLKDINDDAVRALAAAIAGNAIKEYDEGVRKEVANRKDVGLLTKRKLYGKHWRRIYGHKPVPHQIGDAKQFLESEWAKQMVDGDPIRIMHMLRERRGLSD